MYSYFYLLATSFLGYYLLSHYAIRGRGFAGCPYRKLVVRPSYWLAAPSIGLIAAFMGLSSMLQERMAGDGLEAPLWVWYIIIMIVAASSGAVFSGWFAYCEIQLIQYARKRMK